MLSAVCVRAADATGPGTLGWPYSGPSQADLAVERAARPAQPSGMGGQSKGKEKKKRKKKTPETRSSENQSKAIEMVPEILVAERTKVFLVSSGIWNGDLVEGVWVGIQPPTPGALQQQTQTEVGGHQAAGRRWWGVGLGPGGGAGPRGGGGGAGGGAGAEAGPAGGARPGAPAGGGGLGPGPVAPHPAGRGRRGTGGEASNRPAPTAVWRLALQPR